MKMLRFILKPASSWATPLRSDTLSGMLLWRVAEENGDCRAWLEAFQNGNPPFVVSSAMPAGYLPMPALPPACRRDFREFSGAESLFDNLRAYKKFRKLAWIPLSAWQKLAGRLCALDLFKLFLAESGEEEKSVWRGASEARDGFEAHVSMDRSSGGTLAGGLFYSRLKYFAADFSFHLYALARDGDELLRLLRKTGELGFGRDASTGKGQFTADPDPDFREEDLACPKASHKLLLSVCAAPDMSDLSGYYSVEVKNGKAGPGMGSPFKRPFLCLKEGSLIGIPPAGPYALQDIHPNPEVVQIVWPLGLPCFLPEAAQEVA